MKLPTPVNSQTAKTVAVKPSDMAPKPRSAPVSESWSSLMNRLTKVSTGVPSAMTSPRGMHSHLTDLLKLQMDVGRYQLRVEMLSKVADSAMLSIRKMQQSQ